MTLVVHARAKAQLELFRRSLPQSLLIEGESGLGLRHVALELAMAHTKHPIFVGEVTPSGSVGVEVIRDLYQSTRAKQKQTQVYIIDNADLLTHQAQNAFLKLLEEPNEHTHFILTAHRIQALLPTVRSRMQVLSLQRVTTAQSEDLLSLLAIADATKRTQLLFIADGRPSALTLLASDDEAFTKRTLFIRDARELLQGSKLQGLLLAQRYKDDRPGALTLLDDASHILRLSMSQSPQTTITSQLEAVLRAVAAIEANANIRLALARLVLQ